MTPKLITRSKNHISIQNRQNNRRKLAFIDRKSQVCITISDAIRFLLHCAAKICTNLNTTLMTSGSLLVI